MIGKGQHTVPRNRTATVRAAHAPCIARTEPRGLYAESSKCSDTPVSHCVEHPIEFVADWWPLLLSIAILAPISHLSEPERCRSHGDLVTIPEILS